MSMSLAVHKTRTTNSSSSFGYLKNNIVLSFECEPQVEVNHNISSCPLCWFRETPSTSIKEHLSSKEHQKKWAEVCDKSQCSSDDSMLFLEAKESRSVVLKKKKDILRQCGLIPSYIRILWRRDFDILFFYEIPKLRKARIKMEKRIFWKEEHSFMLANMHTEKVWICVLSRLSQRRECQCTFHSKALTSSKIFIGLFLDQRNGFER
ncbi:hypothetical protein LAU_0181 [Lausannevirus]|uniref:Uncharacterized protein n=1 Tax=Lausannevirus TaxID=999883 RepID=F2WLA9_9VIRU|nr:hypothetical protein LAU_0181 [Lausannevirus]AEA07032.1 hypothetical protein LAU_0181 [Lausannevirus]